MRATVVRIQDDGGVTVVTDNQILYDFPAGPPVSLSDVLSFEPVLSGSMRVTNITKGTEYDALIRPSYVHDLRRKSQMHGDQRTPTTARLLEP